MDSRGGRLPCQGAKPGEIFAGNAFVSVEHQDPIASSLLDVEVPRPPQAAIPFVSQNPGARGLGELARAVARAGVYYEYLVYYRLDAGDRPLDEERFVLYNHAERDASHSSNGHGSKRRCSPPARSLQTRVVFTPLADGLSFPHCTGGRMPLIH
ncbi:MAG: hypothetical protein WKF55_04145 [Gemmatimonadaceae bacterium]